MAQMQASSVAEAASIQQVFEAAARAKALAVAKQDEDRAARKKRCDDSREDRLTHAKLALAARMAAETRVLQHAKAIRAACKLRERPTGAVTVRVEGNAWRVAPELADDVQCTKLPTGLTKDDAYVILWRVRNGGDALPSGPILESEDRSPEDDQCAELDRAVGLDFSAPRWEEPKSIDKVGKWSPPP